MADALVHPTSKHVENYLTKNSEKFNWEFKETEESEYKPFERLCSQDEILYISEQLGWYSFRVMSR